MILDSVTGHNMELKSRKNDQGHQTYLQFGRVTEDLLVFFPKQVVTNAFQSAWKPQIEGRVSQRQVYRIYLSLFITRLVEILEVA